MHLVAFYERVLLALLSILVMVLYGNKLLVFARVSKMIGSNVLVTVDPEWPEELKIKLNGKLWPNQVEFFKLLIKSKRVGSEDLQQEFYRNATKLNNLLFRIEKFDSKSDVLDADGNRVPQTSTTTQSNIHFKLTRRSTTMSYAQEKPACVSIKDCHGYPNTRCKGGTCRCWEGFVWSNETTRCEKIVKFRDSCNTSIQCDTKGAICSEGLCQCPQRYDRLSNRCLSYNEARSNESYHLIVVCGGISLCIVLFALSVCVLKSRSCRRDGHLSERRRLLPRYDDLENSGVYPRYLILGDCPLCNSGGDHHVDKPPLYETITQNTHMLVPPPITGSPPPPYSDLSDESLESQSSSSPSQEADNLRRDTAVKSTAPGT